MTFDRHSQFDPLPGLSMKALVARMADDQATSVMAAQQSTVDDLRNKTILLTIHQFQPATPDDYIAYGNALAEFRAETAKLPPLQSAQAATRQNWSAARKAFLDKANDIDNDPGAVEQVKNG